MSDLAPFVAAVIRDQVVLDLQTENKELKQQLQNHLENKNIISITGHISTPLCAITHTDKNTIIGEDEETHTRECTFEGVGEQRPQSKAELENTELCIGSEVQGRGIGHWETGNIVQTCQDAGGGTFYLGQVRTLATSQFDFPELTFEVGPYAEGVVPHLNQFDISPLFYHRNGQLIRPAPSVTFLKAILHEGPTPEALADFRGENN